MAPKMDEGGACDDRMGSPLEPECHKQFLFFWAGGS